MDKDTYERQKAFAGEKKPSMLRRCVGHDYSGRCMYMVTMVTEGRKPLLGKVVGHSEAQPGSGQEPRVALTELGQRVADEWWATTLHHPEIEVVALQMMPDHLHGILFVREDMEKPLGMALRGFKQSCNRHYRELILGVPPAVPPAALPSVPPAAPPVVPSAAPPSVPPAAPPAVPSVALPTQQTKQQQTELQQTEQQQAPKKKDRRGEDRTHGLLFAPGYNDKLLLRHGQLQSWLTYLRDNPRRLLMKREHPDFFRVQRGLTVNGQQFSAIGNRFLLDRPVKLQVQCSRRLTEHQIREKVEECLQAARRGAVLVSPSISPGEKAVMRAAFDEGLPLIVLQENGFTDLAKPGGRRMEACCRGQLLLLAPWEHHNEQRIISRGQCLSLNDMAGMICNQMGSVSTKREPGPA